MKWEPRALRAAAAFCRWRRASGRLRSVQLFVGIDHHLRRFLPVQISVCHTDAFAPCPPDAFPRRQTGAFGPNLSKALPGNVGGPSCILPWELVVRLQQSSTPQVHLWLEEDVKSPVTQSHISLMAGGRRLPTCQNSNLLFSRTTLPASLSLGPK